jgi:hypothetical protein
MNLIHKSLQTAEEEDQLLDVILELGEILDASDQYLYNFMLQEFSATRH